MTGIGTATGARAPRIRRRRPLRAVLATLLLGSMVTTTIPSVGAEPVDPLYCPVSTFVEASTYATYAVRDNKVVQAWGKNTDGQLGDGTVISRTLPARTKLSDVVAVSAHVHYTLALRADGSIWSWGDNVTGQLGTPSAPDRSLPAPVQGIPRARAIAAGYHHAVMLAEDGTVWTWGGGSDGALGDGTQVSRRAPGVVPGLSNAVAVAAAKDSSYAVLADGTVRAWGRNDHGQLGDGTLIERYSPVTVLGVSAVRMVTAGYFHVHATRTDGTVWSWGYNQDGQLGMGTSGSPRPAPAPAPALAGFSTIDAGAYHSIALVSDGTVRAWGINLKGQLGDGTTTSRRLPVPVTGLTGVTALAAAHGHSVALVDGRVRTWGWNGSGQLGNGTLIDSRSPVDSACTDRCGDPTESPRPAAESAYFNKPRGGNVADPETMVTPITDQIVDLVTAAAPGATIRSAVYFLRDEPGIESDLDRIFAAMRCAVRERQVRVRLVTDRVEHEKDPTPVLRLEELDDGLDEGLVTVDFCLEGCYAGRGTGFKMHNKFLTIDDLTWDAGVTEKIVAVSSANWSDKQLRSHYHNDLVVIRDDAAFYDAVSSYWAGLQHCAAFDWCSENPVPYPTPQTVSGAMGVRAHFSPRASGDPQMEELNQVDCAVGGGRVAIVMGTWTEFPWVPSDFDRGQRFITKAASLADTGCEVQILLGKDSPAIARIREHQEGRLRLHLRCLDGESSENGPDGPGVHSKQILVEGTYAGVAGSTVVFTGSTNLTDNALEANDEIWVEIPYAPVHTAYRANFEVLWATASLQTCLEA